MPGSQSESDSGRERTVRGTITFGGGSPAPSQGRLYVRVLDVTMADAPARVLSEQVMDLTGGAAPLTFELRVSAIDQRASYVVSAHADVDSDGAVSIGDFVTMQSYPVLSSGYPDRAEIQLKPVR